MKSSGARKKNGSRRQEKLVPTHGESKTMRRELPEKQKVCETLDDGSPKCRFASARGTEECRKGNWYCPVRRRR